MSKIVKKDEDLPVECVAEVVEPDDEDAIAVRAASQAAEPLRVVEKNVHDYVWNDKEQGYFPVFGSVHGQREIDRRPRRVAATVQDAPRQRPALTYARKLLGLGKDPKS